ncbi:unnamed protein product, partial [Symbiodinium necroappetens]
LFQSFAENSQPRKIADQIPMHELLSELGYGLILTQLLAKYKPFLDIAGPAAIDRFLYTGERHKNESFAAFLAAKEVARQDMELHLQERLSEKVAGRVLLRQANLSDFQRELLALKDQSQLLTFDQVAALLRPLDRPELLAQAAGTELGTAGAKHFPVVTDGNPEDEEEDEEQFLQEEEEEESDSLHDDELYFEDREYNEDEALFISAYHSAYADIRKDLKDRKKERGFVRHRASASQGGKGRGKGRRQDRGRSRDRAPPRRSTFNKVDPKLIKGSGTDLQARVRCFNCQELGHYAKVMAVFHQPQPPSMDHLQIFAGIRVSGSQALVDTAAEDAVIGSIAADHLQQELRRWGLRCLPVSQDQPIPCAGIGGSAKVCAILDVPTCVAGILGVVRFSVVEDSASFQTPPLLPISYLEAIHSILDLGKNRLYTPDGHESPMVRLPSGHRAINVLDFDQTPWELPASFRGPSGVDPFALPASSATSSWGGVAAAT